MSSSQGLHILGPMRVLVSLSDSLWFRFRYVLNSNTSLPMYFFCNTRIHVITLYLDHVYVILCVNALVLAPHMDPG
jgi:hypothetical protein